MSFLDTYFDCSCDSKFTDRDFCSSITTTYGAHMGKGQETRFHVERILSHKLQTNKNNVIEKMLENNFYMKLIPNKIH